MKKIMHKVLYTNFIIGAGYAAYKVFTTPRSEFILRRLYAFEAWLIIGFLSLFFAITENRKN